MSLRVPRYSSRTEIAAGCCQFGQPIDPAGRFLP
jgi:hypothetical protein